MGSLFGKPRSGNVRDDERSGTIGALARSLVASAPPDMVEDLLNTFIQLNKEELVNSRLPWFMPEWIGGLGLPNGISSIYSNSALDFRVAARILMNWSQKSPSPPSGLGENKWQIRRLTQQVTPPLQVTTSRDQSYRSLKKLENHLSIDLLFNSDFQLSDLFNEDGGSVDDSNRKNRNADLWKIGNGKLPPPISEKILFDNPRFNAIAVMDTGVSTRLDYVLSYPHLPKTTLELLNARSSTQGVAFLD
jgi:hypothetical protein